MIVLSSFLEENGFYERAQGIAGTHFTAQDIESVNPTAVSEVIGGRVPGVRVQYGDYGLASTAGDPLGGPTSGSMARAVGRGQPSASGPCVLSVYVDGMLERIDPNLDLVPPEQLAAIEVYIGIDAPIQYSVNRCGVILLWTRRGN